MQDFPEASGFGTNDCMVFSNSNGLLLRPVAAGEWGKGLPYAPDGWPNPGDKWIWKVGRRKSPTGYWMDRYLYPPERLQKAMGKRVKRFPSKPRVREFLETEFPDTNVDTFFSSFQWKVPCACRRQTNAYVEGDNSCGTHSDESEAIENMAIESAHGTRVCKAGNQACSLRIQTGGNTSEAMNCDICCKEIGFCRHCSCILCCKSIDWAFGGYSFVRCEASLDEDYICGHVAHMECALRCQLAGTIESIGLDAEYYCRRCDKKTDLIMHVMRLLQTCESLASPDDIKKVLNLGSCILHGSRQMVARSLLDRIELVLRKLESGICPEEVWKVEDNALVTTAGERSNLRTGTASPATPNSTSDHDSQQAAPISETDQKPFCIPSLHSFASLKLENVIKQVLQSLRESQETEYKIAEQRLYDQKKLLLSLYQQLDSERSEIEKRKSVATEGGLEDLCAGALSTLDQIKRELVKLRQMKQVGKGFGRAQELVLKEIFGLEIED